MNNFGAVLFAEDVARIGRFYEAVAGLDAVHGLGVVRVGRKQTELAQRLVAAVRGGQRRDEVQPRRVELGV